MSAAACHETAAAAAGVHHELPSGVIVGGPLVRAKRVESYILFAILGSGSVAGLAWALTQGVGAVEWSLFALMYALTTLGIGAGVHRMLVHRSFRCGTPVNSSFAPSARWPVRDRF